MKHEQLGLFQSAPPLPEGFRYAPDAISMAEEAHLVAAFADLPFKEFEFHGFHGKRRVVPFGSRYDYNGGGVKTADPIPEFLLPLRDRAAAFAGLPAERLQQALVTEYRCGAAIGWHRDRTMTTWSASRCSRPAPSACGESATAAGSAPRCGSTRARSI
jgi:alkylated DNA repair dioxygenase AlkB